MKSSTCKMVFWYFLPKQNFELLINYAKVQCKQNEFISKKLQDKNLD